MYDLQPGDLITFPLRDDRYGAAKVVHVTDRAFGNLYHLAIYDRLLQPGAGGYDLHGDPVEQSHDPAEFSDREFVVDHLAIAYDGLAASDVVLVGNESVEDDELDGYAVWLQMVREDAQKRGLYRYEVDDAGEEEERSDEESGEESDEEYDDEVADGEERDGDDIAGTEESVSDPNESREATGEANDESGEEPTEEGRAIVVRVWHRQTYDLALGQLLVELHESFDDPELKETEIGDYILSFFDERASGAIDELVARLVDGDYSAGHELLPFGDPAADALGRHLRGTPSPETAADILQILCDMGTVRGYEHIAKFFADHVERSDDPLFVPAVRGYCYAVMLTGGFPEPIRAQLGTLEGISHPEVRDDVRQAVEAIQDFDYSEAPEEKPVAPEASSDPFKGM